MDRARNNVETFMPKAKRAKHCYFCESQDRVRFTFMMCNRCQRAFCGEHGVPHMDQCTSCIEAAEEVD